MHVNIVEIALDLAEWESGGFDLHLDVKLDCMKNFNSPKTNI